MLPYSYLFTLILCNLPNLLYFVPDILVLQDANTDRHLTIVKRSLLKMKRRNKDKLV